MDGGRDFQPARGDSAVISGCLVTNSPGAWWKWLLKSWFAYAECGDGENKSVWACVRTHAHAGVSAESTQFWLNPKNFLLIKDCCVCPTNTTIIIEEVQVCWKFSNIRNNEKLNLIKTSVAKCGLKWNGLRALLVSPVRSYICVRIRNISLQ